MARTWLNDGKPLEDGRLCLLIDPEDGTQAIRVWGRSREEILEKAAKTVEHGARTISQLRSQLNHKTTTAPTTPTMTAATRPPTTLSAAERMQATADLDDPAKAPAAVTRLIQHQTGVDFDSIRQKETIERISTIQANWSYSHPDFPKHPINYKLLNDAAALRVGYENITAAVMDQVYTELSSQGLLVEAEEEELSPTVPPEETPDTRTVRPRGAASYRRTTLSAPAPASQTPKYTRAQIDAMTSAEYRRKLETDPDFVASIAALSGQPHANA
jgi:hypothetical protein